MNYNKNRTTIISSRILLLMTFFITLIFSACGKSENTPTMYIEKATLTEEENDIAYLLGVGDNHHFYDFKADDTIQSIQVNTYKLINGEWQVISASNNNFSDTHGRLALSFENLAVGLQLALQGERNRGSLQYSTESDEELVNMTRSTSMLNDKTEIIYEKEIPLAIQFMTTQNSLSSYNVEFFYAPEEYSNSMYEHVFAVSIMYSQKKAHELDLK